MESHEIPEWNAFYSEASEVRSHIYDRKICLFLYVCFFWKVNIFIGDDKMYTEMY